MCYQDFSKTLLYLISWIYLHEEKFNKYIYMCDIKVAIPMIPYLIVFNVILCGLNKLI